MSGILTMYKFLNMYFQNSTLVKMRWVDQNFFLKIVSNYTVKKYIFSGWCLSPIAAQGKSFGTFWHILALLCFLTYFMSCFSDHLKYEIIDNYLR